MPEPPARPIYWHTGAILARWAGLSLALAVAAIILVACAQEPAQQVSLSKNQEHAGASSQNWTCMGCKTTNPPQQESAEQSPHYLRPGIIRIGVSAMTTPRATLGLYEELLRYVGDKLGKRVELVQRRTYRETNDLLEARLIDVAFVCSLPYILGHDKFGLELLVAPEAGGKPLYYSYVIVRSDSGVESFEGLRGRTFTLMDPESNSGALYPIYRLFQMGESPGSFFRNYVYTYGHDNSIKAVLDKTADGAAVDSRIFDYVSRDPIVASQIKVIEKSPPFAIPPVVVHPAVDPELKQGLRSIFLDMDKDDRGRQILEDMNIDRFVLLDDRAYDSIRKMYYEVQSAGK